ncbi:LAMI_0G08064g1_1 [Lachancea mirantina]|uniref:LAMI_0G08064g1_1 n=1 Tax=Lachancea mirantina TaxID=1230905 RepID=A0A1G4K9U2_9SACH|nr:LAMI_0G08064g1_1 [Lachancea mirantina]
MSSMTIVQLISSENDYKQCLLSLLKLLQLGAGTGHAYASLNPLGEILSIKDAVASGAEVLISQHANLQERLARKYDGGCSEAAAVELLDTWLAQASVLSGYQILFNGSLKLLFSSFAVYRFSKTSQFTDLVLQAYRRVKLMKQVTGASNPQLASLLHGFETRFRTAWSTANCNDFRYDSVRDLQSHSHDVVCPPLLELSQMVKRDTFRLTCTAFGLDETLVELFQLPHGELAIFRINSGKLTHLIESPSQLLEELAANKRTETREMGRSLLFPTIKKDELNMSYMPNGRIALKTKTGNDVILELTPTERNQWETHWRVFFESLFAANACTQNALGVVSANMTKSAHSYQNFKIKHDKLSHLRPQGNEGLAVALPVAKSASATISDTRLVRKTTQLHRSKPLNISLSSVNEIRERPRIEDIENLNFDSLIELDKSISISNSPVSQSLTPSQNHFKVVDRSSSREFAESLRGESAQDGESILSELSLGNENLSFDLDDELFKRPQLMKRKSSSLLSLFSAKKDKVPQRERKNMSVSVPASDSSCSAVSLSTPATNSPPLSPQSDSSPYREIARLVNTTGSTNLCCYKVRMSQWKNYDWEYISGHGDMYLSLHETEDRKVYYVASEDLDKRNVKLCALISSRWKLTRSAAQDAQIKIPAEDLMWKNGDHNINLTLSVRTPQIEGLMRSLTSCLMDENELGMQTSNTLPTISTSSSTFSVGNHRVSRSNTNSTGLSSIIQDSSCTAKGEIVSLLLLSNVKVRLHKKDRDHGWILTDRGLLSVYSLEISNQVELIRFSLQTTNGKATYFETKIHDIRRIGRTGISMVDQKGDFLIEFKAQTMADQVFKLITSLA